MNGRIFSDDAREPEHNTYDGGLIFPGAELRRRDDDPGIDPDRDRRDILEDDDEDADETAASNSRGNRIENARPSVAHFRPSSK